MSAWRQPIAACGADSFQLPPLLAPGTESLQLVGKRKRCVDMFNFADRAEDTTSTVADDMACVIGSWPDHADVGIVLVARGLVRVVAVASESPLKLRVSVDGVNRVNHDEMSLLVVCVRRH